MPQGLFPVVCFLAGEPVDDRHYSVHSRGQADRDGDEVLVGRTILWGSITGSGLGEQPGWDHR